jgi:hypothetical protein
LTYIGSTLAKLGMAETATRVDLDNIAVLCSLFDVSRRKFADDDMSSVIAARTLTNSADIDLFGRGYDNRSVRSLFFLGNLIFCHSGALPDGRMFIASYGAAMIHDLMRAMPNDEVIRESLRTRYPDISFAVDGLRQSFNPDTVISSFAKFALESADEIGGLYLLISKETVPSGNKHE